MDSMVLAPEGAEYANECWSHTFWEAGHYLATTLLF